MKIYQRFLSENQFLEVKFSIYLNRRVFVMSSVKHPSETRIIKHTVMKQSKGFCGSSYCYIQSTLVISNSKGTH